ncbi:MULTISPECIES: WXG100 family type VII secretion target [Actinoallomurus]|uniref:WXG100 family type VII secretion target n=1 Tax=Actinoallomurus TaxID=667113 RepID=UPI0020925400|nr:MULTISPECIES: WXG100 family type VII secretion target [Actinoallomurus]MCO5968785.1 WXG100 family type VII secretion target [Actinoallomurus soli]MCO5996124.1 WXG100 family type VII secretion target [Actinoallomurus rhizosphaericola]
MAPGNNGDYTDVNFHGMAQAEADFSLVFRAVEDELQDLNKDLKNILGTWVGDTHNAYGQVYDKWNKAADDMKNVLGQLGITIKDIHSGYSEAELHNARLWQ